MKNFLQNLLIFLSLCLCALVAFQWVREIQLRKEVQALADTIQGKSERVQGLERTIRVNQDEITRLDGLKNTLMQTARSNDLRITGLSKEAAQYRNDLERAEAQLAAYKSAMERANQSIQRQNETIQKLNAELLKLSGERNHIVSNYNKLAGDYKALVQRWNKQQEDLATSASAGTNSGSR